MARDYQCDGCGKYYDLNNYSGGSTCRDCGGKIELIVDTYSVYHHKTEQKTITVNFIDPSGNMGITITTGAAVGASSGPNSATGHVGEVTAAAE